MERQTTLGARLRQVMEERALSYDALARLLEMRSQTLNRYVLGQREPKANVAVDMALRLEVEPLWLMGYDCPQTRTDPPGPQPTLPLLPVYPDLTWEEPVSQRAADLPEPGDYCYLQVPDERCLNAGLRPGDLVLLRRQAAAETGQLAVCQVGSEPPELVRYTRQGDIVLLQPEYPGAQPRILTATDFQTGNAKVLAVALRLIRAL